MQEDSLFVPEGLRFEFTYSRANKCKQGFHAARGELKGKARRRNP